MLSNGWRITEQRMSIAKEEIKIGLVLARGKEREFLEAVNDRQLVEYVRNFVKFQDAYGNNQFIYVDDLESYKRQIGELSEKGMVPKRSYKVLIGDKELLGVHLYHLLKAGPSGPHVGAAHFFVDLEKNPDFCQLDLRDEVKIIWTDNDELAFGGFIHEASYGDNSAVFLCYGGSRRLHQGRIMSEFIGMKGEDMLQFLASHGGFKTHFDGSLQPNLQEREFKVIFPIEGLKIPCDFQIQSTLFTPDLTKQLPTQTKAAKALSKAPWSTTASFAVVVLKTKHWYQALTDAEILVTTAINWLQFRTDITAPCVTEDGIVKRIYYSLARNFSRCRLVRYGLAIEQATGSSVYCQLDIRAGHPLILKHDPEEFLSPFVSISNRLAQSVDGNENAARSLYQALGWLMRSLETESQIDNLLQLWIALEFICAKEKIPRRVDIKNLTMCIEAIERLSIPPSEELAFVRSIRNVNDPSLMERWNHLINTLGMKLTEREEQLIAKMRHERNKVEHGKGPVEISVEDVEKFRSILERVFILKVTNLIERGYAIPCLGDLFK